MRENQRWVKFVAHNVIRPVISTSCGALSCVKISTVLPQHFSDVLIGLIDIMCYVCLLYFLL